MIWVINALYIYPMKLADLINYLENWAPPAYQESYDNSRLLVGNSAMEVTGVLVSLDCTEDVLEEAIRRKCNVVVAHHPIVFGGLKSLTGKNYVERTVIKAIKKDIAIYALHTNLDNVQTGVNHKIAHLIGLQNQAILLPMQDKLMRLEVVCPIDSVEQLKNSLFAIGVGAVGKYRDAWFSSEGKSGYTPSEKANPRLGKIGEAQQNDELKLMFTFPSYQKKKVLDILKNTHPYEEFDYAFISLENTVQDLGAGMIGELPTEEALETFLQRVKSTFGCGVIKYTKSKKDTVRKVAVCGGAGFFLLQQAIAQQADVYITSDVKYHDFFDAEDRIVLADIGHYESEQFTKELIVDYLKKRFSDDIFNVSDTVTNPVHYL